MKSVLYASEVTANRNRKFGAASTYYPARFVRANGTAVPALFTEAEINHAVARARANGEDIRAVDDAAAVAARWKWITVTALVGAGAVFSAVIVGLVL